MEEYISVPKSKLLELKEAIDQYRYLLARLKRDMKVLNLEHSHKRSKN